MATTIASSVSRVTKQSIHIQTGHHHRFPTRHSAHHPHGILTRRRAGTNLQLISHAIITPQPTSSVVIMRFTDRIRERIADAGVTARELE